MYSVSFFVWIMVAVFAAGFGAGFGLRSYVSYRRRTRTRPKRADVRPEFVPGHVEWSDAPLVPAEHFGNAPVAPAAQPEERSRLNLLPHNPV